MNTTKHNHPMVFGRLQSNCPRCTELKLGMPARKWNNYRASSEASRLTDIKAHDCKKSGCGVVCTAFDW